MTTDKAAAKTTNDPLVGRWFHSITVQDDGCRLVKWQGEVLDRVHPNMYLLQLYDWFVGAPSSTTLVPAADMAGWEFYDSNKDMTGTYEHVYGPRGMAHERHEQAAKS